MSKKSPKEVASEIRSRYFAGDVKKPQDAFLKIFKENRIIKESSCENNESLRKNEDGSWTITIPHSTSQLRDNFTIAHELAHFFMHTDEGRKTSFRRSGDRTTEEIEANKFAAELLMPEEEFREQAKRLNNSEVMLSYHFGVSQLAVSVRLSALKITDQ